MHIRVQIPLTEISMVYHLAPLRKKQIQKCFFNIPFELQIPYVRLLKTRGEIHCTINIEMQKQLEQCAKLLDNMCFLELAEHTGRFYLKKMQYLRNLHRMLLKKVPVNIFFFEVINRNCNCL